MASLPYPRTLLQQCSPTDFTDLHRWLGCVVGSHRIHRIHRSLLLRRNSHRFVGGYGIPAIPTHPVTVMFSHRFHGFTQMVRLRSGLPQNSQNSQKFIAEKKLPQISRIYTDVSKIFCVFREFCGSKYLCKSVKSVGEYSLSVCSLFREFCGSKYLCKSVKSVGVPSQQ